MSSQARNDCELAHGALRGLAKLDFGDHTLPAGQYSLFLFPTARGGELIINAMTRQRGTQYDRRRDVLRVALVRRSDLGGIEERLRLYIANDALVIHWDGGGYTVSLAGGGQ